MKNLSLVILSLLLCSCSDAKYRAQLKNAEQEIDAAAITSGGIIQVTSDSMNTFREHDLSVKDGMAVAVDQFEKDGTFERLKKEQDHLQSTMAALANPPASMKSAYDKLMDLYGQFNELSGFAISPTGTFGEYDARSGELMSKYGSTSKQLKAMLP